MAAAMKPESTYIVANPIARAVFRWYSGPEPTRATPEGPANLASMAKEVQMRNRLLFVVNHRWHLPLVRSYRGHL